jgi:hypothetical protein
MAQAAIAVLADPVRWQTVSAAAAADARARFAERDVVAQYEALYERTVATARPHRTPAALPVRA